MHGKSSLEFNYENSNKESSSTGFSYCSKPVQQLDKQNKGAKD